MWPTSHCASLLIISLLFFKAAAELPYFHSNASYGILSKDLTVEARDLPIGTCDAATPCPNGACCSGNGSGLCGYSPAECGASSCTSNCDAKAECGEYGRPGHQTCPLKVCCSKFGFCGSANDFCDVSAGCQADFGGCGPVTKPSCSKDGGSVSKRYIGYYESWANTRPCGKVAPEDLNLDGLTHVNFAFVFFDPGTFQIVPMDKNAGSLLSRFTKMKERKAGLQTWVSVGGWSFNDPGPYQMAFSDMAKTAANRKTFIDGLMNFMDTYGFDGMDLDWEYPSADDRGGRPEDTANFVLLSKDIKEAFGGEYGYSITLPASYWYLQHFDLAGHQLYVDWFNIMSYDLHGVWDAASKFIGPYVAAHTNITEIDQGMELLWRAGVKPEMVTLGQGFYGRSFTLSDPACNKPNGMCQFSGGANAGPCSGASGILNLQEILDIIKEKNLTPVHDKSAGVKWIHWDDDQWVSYDDAETLAQKRDFGNSRCLGGLMIWALDQVDQKTKSVLYPKEWTEEEIEEAESEVQDQEAQGVCYTTECNKECRTGDHEASQMNGQPGQLSTLDRCSSGQYRRLCCSKGTIMGVCKWKGYRGLGMTCMGSCGYGEKTITQNTNHKLGKEEQSCMGGTQSYCCAGFTPPITKAQVVSKVEDAAADLALELAASLALEIAAKAFCRIAITAALMPLSFIPFVGWIIRLAVQAAVPALANLCAKGIAKAGKGVFKFKGKDYEIPYDKPTSTKVDRQPSADPTQPSTKAGSCTRRALQKRFPDRHKLDTIELKPPAEVVSVRTCTGDEWFQACFHYRSVISRFPEHSTITCVKERHLIDNLGPLRDERNKYEGDHKRGWFEGFMQSQSVRCERDEYPPAALWQGRDVNVEARSRGNVWIRFSPRDGNNKAGGMFSRICPSDIVSNNVGQPVRRRAEVNGPCDNPRTTWWSTQEYRVTNTAFSMAFTRMPAYGDNANDNGLAENPCYPSILISDPGFALKSLDPWYNNKNAATKAYRELYKHPPPNDLLLVAGAGGWPRTGWTKRDNDQVDPEQIFIDEGNSTRKPTKEELLEDFGLLRCKDGCEEEMEKMGVASLPYENTLATTPCAIAATTTALMSMPTTLSKVSITASGILKEIASMITPPPER